MTDALSSSLKEENALGHRAFVAANAVLFAVVVIASGVPTVDMAGLWSATKTFGIPAVLGPLGVTILLGLLPRKLVEVIVFWRWTERLPSFRAFSDVPADDPRIDLAKIERRIGKVPVAPVEQSRIWYQCYSEVRNEPSVRSVHKRYLSMRDATALVFLATGVFVPLLVLVVRPPLLVSVVYGCVMALQYMLIRIAAKRYGEQLVAQVLAVTCTMP